MRKAIGWTALVVCVGMLALVGGLAVWQTVGEVEADATTTGTVTAHTETPNRQSWTYGCRFTYTVDGQEHEGHDGCDQDAHPVGSEIEVRYVADRPGTSILRDDVSSGDAITRWALILGGFGVVLGALVWWAGPSRRRRGTA